MPLLITNIPHSLQGFWLLPRFGFIIAFNFSEKCSYWLWEGFLSGWGRPLKAKSAIFPRKRSSRNDTKTPGTGKTLLSPRKYLWCLVAFVEAREWAGEKVTIFLLVQKSCAQKWSLCKVLRPSGKYWPWPRATPMRSRSRRSLRKSNRGATSLTTRGEDVSPPTSTTTSSRLRMESTSPKMTWERQDFLKTKHQSW